MAKWGGARAAASVLAAPTTSCLTPKKPFRSMRIWSAAPPKPSAKLGGRLQQSMNTSAQIHLLFSKQDTSLALTCPPPGSEPITIRLDEAENLRVRIPSWADPSDVSYKINDVPRASAAAAIEGGYLKLSDLEPGAVIKIWLPTRKETVSEVIGGQAYAVEWRNDTVVGISPRARFRALYGLD